jgi:hypothetical protein
VSDVPFWDNPAVVGALGIAFGGATAYIQGALSARSKAGEELRERRLEAYPTIWQETASISRYPSTELTWADVKALHLAFRRWYFTSGGMFLSERSRDRYGDVQELLGAYLAGEDDEARLVELADYETLAETCSAFRTAMTEDLATRRQRSPVWALASWRWHRGQKRQAREHIEKAGGGTLRLPLNELRLAARPRQPGPGAESG